jgi:hypothetical protein
LVLTLIEEDDLEPAVHDARVTPILYRPKVCATLASRKRVGRLLRTNEAASMIPAMEIDSQVDKGSTRNLLDFLLELPRD